MKIKFGSFLLLGKVATLPSVLAPTQAAVFPLPTVTPTFADITTSSLSIIEIPATQVLLQNLRNDASATTNTSHASASALLCPSTATSALPVSMSVVVTGVSGGDTVYVFGALDKNYTPYTSLNPRLTIGNSALAPLAMMTVTSSVSGTISSISVPVDLSAHAALVNAGTFYLQAISVPANSDGYMGWRVSELDQISVGQFAKDSYGNVSAYCS